MESINLVPATGWTACWWFQSFHIHWPMAPSDETTNSIKRWKLGLLCRLGGKKGHDTTGHGCFLFLFGYIKHLSKTRHSWDFLVMGTKHEKQSSTLLRNSVGCGQFWGPFCSSQISLGIPCRQKGIWPCRSTSSTEARVRPHWQREVEHGKRIYGCFHTQIIHFNRVCPLQTIHFGAPPILETPHYTSKTVGKKNRFFTI